MHKFFFSLDHHFNLPLFRFLIPQGEVNDLILNLQGHLNESVDLEEYFGVSVSNIICSLLMSEKFTKDDQKFIEFNRMIQEGKSELFEMIKSEIYQLNEFHRHGSLWKDQYR